MWSSEEHLLVPDFVLHSVFSALSRNSALKVKKYFDRNI